MALSTGVTAGITTATAPVVFSSTRFASTTSSALSPFATTAYSGGLAACEGTSWANLDLTGLHGTICRASPPSNVDISPCCEGSVHLTDTCTRYCQVSDSMTGLTSSQSAFSDCLRTQFNGDMISNECGILRSNGTTGGTGTVPRPANSTASPGTPGYTPTPSLACRPDSFPNYDTTGMNGTVCAISVRPENLNITSCCSGRVRVFNDCTQFCETRSQVGSLFTDRAQFSDCVEQRNGGQSVDNMCQTVYASNSSTNGTRPQPYTGGAGSTQAGVTTGALVVMALAAMMVLDEF